MAQGPSPLVGYNTNVRHKGKLYHIQTEDSGVNHPHIITHMFADGGRIIASSKTSYAEQVGSADLQVLVKQMMKEQHKAMFIALRDGVYDEDEDGSAPVAKPAPAKKPSEKPPSPKDSVDLAALDAAAAKLSDQTPSTRPRYSSTRAPEAVTARASSRPTGNIFGGDLLSEKSLDEVILSYLAEDLEEG